MLLVRNKNMKCYVMNLKAKYEFKSNKILFTTDYNINCNIIIIHDNTKIILVEYFEIIIL